MPSTLPLPTVAPDSQAHRLVRDTDWSASPLGPPAQWPALLRRLMTFILESPEPMWFAWGEDRRMFFNDAYLPLLGGKLDGAMGEKLEVIWWDVWKDVRQAVEDTFQGHASRFVDLFLKMDRDGTMRDTFWTFSYSPVRGENDQVMALFCIVSEQTERVLGEQSHQQDVASLTEDAQRAQRELLNAREQLRQAQKLEAIGQLTGGVAHDFNNLLQVIHGSVELLQLDQLDADRRRRYLDAISSAAKRASKLTNQLLAFSRRQTLTPEVFDLGASLRELADILRTLVGSRVRVEVTVPDAPLPVLIDHNQLDTALINLAANARDAMGGEGVLAIEVRAVDAIPALRTLPDRPGRYVAITVADKGTGIAEADLERIFEPFFTTKAVGEGTGLGLSQVFGFVRQSDGDIAVESQPGKGSRFTLYLPGAHQDVLVPGARAPRPLMEERGQVHVLVVEDNAGVAEFVTLALDELGYLVTLVRDGRQALDVLATRAAAFDVVFSDVVMPGVNGLELARHVRAHHPGLPVVLASGYSELLADDPDHGFEVLRKPYSLAQLLDTLRTALR